MTVTHTVFHASWCLHHVAGLQSIGGEWKKEVNSKFKMFEIINMFIINQCVLRQCYIYSKWAVGLKVRTKTVQFLE